MPKPRPVWPGKSASIRTYGSSRPKTAPGGISWTGSCIDGPALEALGQRAEPRTQARDRDIAQSTGIAVHRDGPRPRSRIVRLCLRAPQGKKIARRAAIKAVIEFGEVVNPPHRMTDRGADQQQDALEYRNRHAGGLGGNHHGLARRIVDYPLAQMLRNVGQAFEFAGELADPAVQCGDIEPLINAFAIFGGGLDVIAATERNQRQQSASLRRGGSEKSLAEFRRMRIALRVVIV